MTAAMGLNLSAIEDPSLGRKLSRHSLEPRAMQPSFAVTQALVALLAKTGGVGLTNSGGIAETMKNATSPGRYNIYRTQICREKLGACYVNGKKGLCSPKTTNIVKDCQYNNFFNLPSSSRKMQEHGRYGLAPLGQLSIWIRKNV